MEKAGPNMAIAKKKIYRSLVKRTLILIILGMVINGALQLPGYEHTRFASVLGRIAISCFFGALIFLNTNLRGQVAWFFGLLLGYWAIMMLVPVPGYGAGNLTEEGNLAAYVDRLMLPGRLHTKYYDPEGFLSNIPATCSALLGIFTGRFLRWQSPAWSMKKKAMTIAAAGLMLLACGWIWNFVFPVNKNMWTSSFVLVAGGWSALLLSLFYYVTDILQIKKWSMPFVWLGMNSILIYVASHGAVNFESTSHFVFGGLVNKIPALWQDAFLWTGVAIIQFAFLYVLYKKKIFLKV
jgi:predicted acyltransferase